MPALLGSDVSPPLHSPGLSWAGPSVVHASLKGAGLDLSPRLFTLGLGQVLQHLLITE